MGQAKQRGPFEERKQQAMQAREAALVAQEIEFLSAQRAEDERYDRMAPAERAAYNAAQRRRRDSLSGLGLSYF